MQNQGVQASAFEDVVTECGARVLTTVSPAPHTPHTSTESLVALTTRVIHGFYMKCVSI